MNRWKIIIAIAKSQEWKDVAIENGVSELNKRIPLDEDLSLVAFRNYGHGWQITPLLIEYRFSIMEVDENIRYFLVLSYRTVDETNDGVQGSFLVWDVDEKLSELDNLISDEMIKKYQNQISKKVQEADLFN